MEALPELVHRSLRRLVNHDYYSSKLGFTIGNANKTGVMGGVNVNSSCVYIYIHPLLLISVYSSLQFSNNHVPSWRGRRTIDISGLKIQCGSIFVQLGRGLGDCWWDKAFGVRRR